MRYVTANPSEVGEDEVIEIATFGGDHLKQVQRRELCEIASARVEEIIEMIGRNLIQSGNDSLLRRPCLDRRHGRVARHPAAGAAYLGYPGASGPASRLGDLGCARHRSRPRAGGSDRRTCLFDGHCLLLWGLERERTDQGLGYEPRGGSLLERIKRWLRVLLP